MPNRIAPHTGEPAIEVLGDVALLLRFEQRIDVEVNARVHEAARALRAARLPGIVELVPAYASLTLAFDEAMDIDAGAIAGQVREVLARGAATAAPRRVRQVFVPVLYGGEHGPDLATVAAHAGITEAEVVRRHAAGDYTVAMLGFLPGFPYLLGLDPSIALPRRATPRTRVPAGSVGIGSAQTGIYPCASPGGWHLIGHTPVRLFDSRQAQPALLAPGDRVRFEPMDADRIAGARVRIEHEAARP